MALICTQSQQMEMNIKCKTIVDVRIYNGQLKICGPFIFNQTVHLVIFTKCSTDQSIYFKYYGPTYFQLSIEYEGINYCA
jgi:phenolic acid decarboxylase